MVGHKMSQKGEEIRDLRKMVAFCKFCTIRCADELFIYPISSFTTPPHAAPHSRQLFGSHDN